MYTDEKGRLEYPPEHIGRKSYVTVAGYNYSVPKIYCYMSGGRYYLLGTEAPGDASAYVISDIQPYKSVVDGSMITSRSQHREHLRHHGVIEVGNEYPKPRRDVPMPRAGYDIKRALQR